MARTVVFTHVGAKGSQYGDLYLNTFGFSL